jgi:glycine/D-amino acid oxidase-like deaminating enzyme
MAEAWGSPPWHVGVALPAAPAPPRVDVAVVGAGFAGLATAFELTRRGVRVAVLEAGRIGTGASGHSGAIALEGTAVGLLEGAETCLESLERMTRTAGVDCDLELGGCWELAHRDHPGETRPCWTDGDAFLTVADTVPGGTLDAGAILGGLARAIVDRGGTIHEAQEVRGIGTGRVLDTSRGRVAADRVVIAVNAYTPNVLTLPVDLRPVLTLALATAPLDATALEAIGIRHPFYTVDMPYLWGRPLGERLIFGAGLVFPADRDVRTTRIDEDDARNAFGRLEARIHRLHPALASIAIERRWGGPISFVPSRAPVLTALPDDPRVVVTGGCAGHGVALSFRLGELVADHLTEGRPLPAWGRFGA